MEYEDSFKDLFLEEDTSILYLLGKSLLRLEEVIGDIKKIKGKGKYSKLLAEIYSRIRRIKYERNKFMADSKEPNKKKIGIETMIIIDRTIDLVTPMCTQLTYEGLIDEIFHIKNGCVDIDSKLIELTKEKEKPPPPQADKKNDKKKKKLQKWH